MTQAGNIRQPIALTREELLQKIKDDDDDRDTWPVQRRHLHAGEWETACDRRARRATPWDGLIQQGAGA